MSARIRMVVCIAAVLIVGIFYASSANAQGAPASSLADRLKTQYGLAKLSMDSNGANEGHRQVPGGQSSSTGLRNEDIIKLVQAKLPDSIVIAKIKSSSCNFDTTADGLIKLKQAGISDSVLQAMVEAPPPPEPTGGTESGTNPATCNDYGACISSGNAALGSSQWDDAIKTFQAASSLDASKSDAWAGMGNAYFQMGQYEDAVRMWDKALELGATLSSFVCHAKAACGDTGDFLLSTKEISFVNKKGEKEFAAAPSAVTSEVGTPPVLFGNGRIVAYYLQIRFSGRNYRFYYDPKSPQCRSNFLCSEPGLTQQKVFADYVHGALVRMAAGDSGSRPNKP